MIRMRFDSVIYLLSTTNSTNDLGDSIKIHAKRQVFAEKKSVRQSEFYQAAATGLKPEIAFEIWSREYQQEQLLDYEGILYTIIRTFKKGEITELIGEGVVNHANA